MQWLLCLDLGEVVREEVLLLHFNQFAVEARHDYLATYIHFCIF